MVDQKQGATSKDEKAGKPVAGDSNAGVGASAATAAGNDTATKAAPAAPTKMELATEIYKRMRAVRDETRKDIIEKFIAEVKLTKAGASTYYQMIKDKHEPQSKKRSLDDVLVYEGPCWGLSFCRWRFSLAKFFDYLTPGEHPSHRRHHS